MQYASKEAIQSLYTVLVDSKVFMQKHKKEIYVTNITLKTNKPSNQVQSTRLIRTF